MKKIIGLLIIALSFSCGGEKKENVVPVVEQLDKFSISFVATYPKDDSLSVVYKKDGFWNYDNPIALKVKGQELAQKFTVDIPEGDYLENFQVTVSTNKGQKEIKIEDVSIIYNEKLFFDGSNLKHVSYFNSNSGLKWDDVNKTLQLNFDGQFPPGFVGNEQLETIFTK